MGIVKGLTVVVIVVAAAWLLGTGVGDWINAKEYKDYAFRRQIKTAEVLERMGTINIGDTLTNTELMDLSGEYKKLSDLITDKNIFVFFDYQCGNCLNQLTEINKAIDNSANQGNILLVSSSNPLTLQNLSKELQIKCGILYDEDRAFTTSLGIFTFPFSLVIDKDLSIDQITAGVLSESEIIQILGEIAYNPS